MLDLWLLMRFGKEGVFTVGGMIHPGTNELIRQRNEMTLPLDLLSLGSAGVSSVPVTFLELG